MSSVTVPTPRPESQGQRMLPSTSRGSSHAPGTRAKAIRVAHACERCKARKIRCNGERPTCRLCREAAESCRYAEKKRDVEKRRVDELEAKANLYEKLLRDIHSHPTHSGLQLAVEKALAGDTSYYSRLKRDQPFLSFAESPCGLPPPTGNGTGSSAPGTPASSRELPAASFEHISQDINTFGVNNPFGYLGKCSCLWWIQRAREEMGKSIPLSVAIDTMVDPRVPAVEKLDATMYHLDDLGLPETDREVTPYTIPPREVADVLVHDYFRTVHCAFPILSKPVFLSQYDQLYSPGFEPFQAGTKWLGIFNLVLAIGRSHCNLTGEAAAGYDYQADYFLRARMLEALDGGILFQIPDLQHVQILGLAANYLLANHRINRAWNIACMAICQAQGLGLHLDSHAPTLNTVTKNIRNCVWHTLYSVETALVLITGRVPLIREIHCSAPVPGDVQHDGLLVDDDGNVIPDAYLLSQRGLFAIINESVMQLYNTQNSYMTQLDYQDRVAQFEARLAAWKLQIPEELNFDGLPTRAADATLECEKRLDLAVRYHNARMIIHRPFLCTSASPSPSPSTNTTTTTSTTATTSPPSPPPPSHSHLTSARACIQSACALTLLVTRETPQTMMKCGPWWCLVHFLSTAASVVVLELSFHSKHVPADREQLFHLGDRIVAWFKGLQHVDMSSRRCYIVLEEMMRLLRLDNDMPNVVVGDQCLQTTTAFPGGDHQQNIPPPESLQSLIAGMDLGGEAETTSQWGGEGMRWVYR